MTLTLSQKQQIFALNVAKLIIHADSIGIKVTLGEAWRTEAQQRIYLRSGLTKTMKSRHLDRLAVDLNVFIDGKYRTDATAYKPLADYWKSLHVKNVAGFDWGWDANHFEMTP